MTDKLGCPVRRVMRMLVDGKYEELVALTHGQRLSADEMRQAIANYGRTPVAPPDEAYNELDAIRIRDSCPPAWSVRMPLWVQEGGRSDLTVEMTIGELERGFRIEVDDIHVL